MDWAIRFFCWCWQIFSGIYLFIYFYGLFPKWDFSVFINSFHSSKRSWVIWVPRVSLNQKYTSVGQKHSPGVL
uniref:Uncharacterized protein n=1 Tax=Anguilla anguilla TaxID=7936 RepID=A0A0E9PCF4_ANGAN